MISNFSAIQKNRKVGLLDFFSTQVPRIGCCVASCVPLCVVSQLGPIAKSGKSWMSRWPL